MGNEKRAYIYHALFYNCLMLAAAIIAFAVSLWLAVSGRLWGEGVDGRRAVVLTDRPSLCMLT
jgi:hypothetical protein